MKLLTPMKSIKAKCLDCCVGSVGEVNKCEAFSCPLYILTEKVRRQKTAPFPYTFQQNLTSLREAVKNEIY